MVVSLARNLGLSAIWVVCLIAHDGQCRTVPTDDGAPVEPANYTSSPLDAWLRPNREAPTEDFWDSCLASRTLDVGASRVPTSFDWWSHELTVGRRYRFADPGQFVLLRRYAPTVRDRGRPRAFFWASQFDAERFPSVPNLSWRMSLQGTADLGPQRTADDATLMQSTSQDLAMSLDVSTSQDPSLARGVSREAEASLSWFGLGALAALPPINAPAMKQRKCPAWARPRPVIVTSWGSDYDRLALFDCDGSIAVDALDRVSALARIMGQKRPPLPLPDQANPPDAWPDEWVEGVRLLHPRLLWLLQRIGEAYPKRVVHILSGYRRDARDSSPHRNGRALDLSVRGVTKEQLFAYCMSLRDVGCGYYPYHPFVHFDVRPVGTPKVYWVDASEPGERSRYVDSWLGVVDHGALAGATDGE